MVTTKILNLQWFWYILGIIVMVIVSTFLYKYFAGLHISLKFDRIKPYINKEDGILDFGSGDGCLTKYLIDQGYKNTVGIDVVSKGKCMDTVLYDGRTIPYPDKYFDVAICAFVLHHTSDQELLLKEIGRVTKKYILIFEDIPENMIDKYMVSQHALSEWGRCNECFHTNDEWKNIFKRFGMKLIGHERISRWEFPFSNQPWIYCVPASLFIINPPRPPVFCGPSCQ